MLTRGRLWPPETRRRSRFTVSTAVTARAVLFQSCRTSTALYEPQQL